MVYAHRGWDWTLCFFPGSLWYLYNLTSNEYWQQKEEKYTEYLHKEQYNISHHDIGFIIGCSILNGMRMGNRKEYTWCRFPDLYLPVFVLMQVLFCHGMRTKDVH